MTFLTSNHYNGGLKIDALESLTSKLVCFLSPFIYQSMCRIRRKSCNIYIFIYLRLALVRSLHERTLLLPLQPLLLLGRIIARCICPIIRCWRLLRRRLKWNKSQLLICKIHFCICLLNASWPHRQHIPLTNMSHSHGCLSPSFVSDCTICLSSNDCCCLLNCSSVRMQRRNKGKRLVRVILLKSSKNIC